MKRALSLILIAALALCLCACGSKEVQKEAPAAAVTASDQSQFTWQIELRDSAIKDALHTDAGVTQYDGGVLDVAYDNAPASGNKFLILTLTVTKAAAGGGSFDWKKLSVQDSDGNSYVRMENDAFLSTHTYKRMPGTALQIGENKGSICIEIPAKTAEGTLTLVYDAGDQGMNKLPIQ